MNRRGVTLIELLTALGLSLLLLSALSVALSVALQGANRTDGPKERHDQNVRFENRIRGLIERTFLTESEDDLQSYMIGRTVGGGSETGGADELVFTTLSQPISGSAAISSEPDFEARNEQFGPVGSGAEVALSMVAVGNAGDRQGLFLREQIPPDFDPDQGGYEVLLDDDIQSISFEFWDGQDWQLEWDTQVVRVLPRAVRVTYVRTSDPEVSRVFVVALSNSSSQAPGQGQETAFSSQREGGNL